MISIEDKKRIIERAFVGKEAPYAKSMPPSLIVLGGLPAAGKTTVLSQHEDDSFVYASPDWVKVEANNYSLEFHSTATAINAEIINKSRKGGYNLLLDSLLDNYGRAAGTIRQYLAKNGAVQIVYAHVSCETSRARSTAREVLWELEQKPVRHVPARVIIRSYNYSLPTLLALYKKYESDPRVNFLIYDNDVDFREPCLIAEKAGDSLRLYDEKIFDELRSTDYFCPNEGHYERTQALAEKDFDDRCPRAGHRAVELVLQECRQRGWPEMEREEIYRRVLQK